MKQKESMDLVKHAFEIMDRNRKRGQPFTQAEKELVRVTTDPNTDPRYMRMEGSTAKIRMTRLHAVLKNYRRDSETIAQQIIAEAAEEEKRARWRSLPVAPTLTKPPPLFRSASPATRGGSARRGGRARRPGYMRPIM